MRNRFPRSFYIPQGAQKVADKASDAVAYAYAVKGMPCVVVFCGKRDKPDGRYSFASEAKREAYVRRYFAERQAAMGRTTTRRETLRADAAKARETYAVGDVLRSVWGYDQTNVDYYQVTARSGAMVTLRKIAKISEEYASMQGHCVPEVDAFVGEPFRARIGAYGVKVSYGQTARKIEPQTVAGVRVFTPDNWTSYA